jgi:TRAP-type C4-dicarboxylate transport system substrate-binding protein
MIGNPILMKMAESMGASPVSMASGQMFGAIQSDVIDGAENNPPSLISFNHAQIVKYYTLNEHVRLPEVLIINRALWNKLSPEQQKALNTAADGTVKFQRKAWDAFEVEAMKKIKEAGVIVTEVKDKTPWRKAVQAVFDAEAGPFAETIKAIEAARPRK